MIPFMQIVKNIDKGLMLLVGQCIEFIIFVMMSIMMLWLYTPYNLLIKILITLFFVIVTYDVFRHFVYVKWILYKEQVVNAYMESFSNVVDREIEEQK